VKRRAVLRAARRDQARVYASAKRNHDRGPALVDGWSLGWRGTAYRRFLAGSSAGRWLLGLRLNAARTLVLRRPERSPDEPLDQRTIEIRLLSWALGPPTRVGDVGHPEPEAN
jgi:hypothetical protein